MRKQLAVLLIVLCIATTSSDGQEKVKSKNKNQAEAGKILESGPSEYFTGIYIQIDTSFIERTRAVKTTHYRDVVIRFNGKEVEMTYEEFLERVGLKEKQQ